MIPWFIFLLYNVRHFLFLLYDIFIFLLWYIFLLLLYNVIFFLFFVVDLQPETVTQFLFDNPDFLDSFVQQHVHEDKIRQWSQRKHKVQGHNPVALTNGENF